MAAYVPQGDRAKRQLFAVGSFSKVLVFLFRFLSHVFSLGAPDMGGDGFIYSDDEVEMMMCRGRIRKVLWGFMFMTALSFFRPFPFGGFHDCDGF